MRGFFGGLVAGGVALAVIPASAQPIETIEPGERVQFEDGHTGEMVEVPRAWLAVGDWAAPIPTVAAAELAPERPVARARETTDIVHTPRPTAWMPSARPDCQRYRGRRVCDGPLRIARPAGAGLEQAQRLALGTDQVARHLLTHGPTPPWVAAARELSVGARARTLRFPVERGAIGRGVGMVRRRNRPGRRLHKGVDIGGARGSRVLAANDGLVAYANNGVRGYGNLVMIVHPDASVTFYAHLDAAYVFAGSTVVRGQTIGELGNTGLSSGPHLHFEWRVAGQPSNPVPRFRAPPGTMAQAR